jgi:hypothetical protein
MLSYIKLQSSSNSLIVSFKSHPESSQLAKYLWTYDIFFDFIGNSNLAIAYFLIWIAHTLVKLFLTHTILQHSPYLSITIKHLVGRQQILLSSIWSPMRSHFPFHGRFTRQCHPLLCSPDRFISFDLLASSQGNKTSISSIRHL